MAEERLLTANEILAELSTSRKNKLELDMLLHGIKSRLSKFLTKARSLERLELMPSAVMGKELQWLRFSAVLLLLSSS